METIYRSERSYLKYGGCTHLFLARHWSKNSGLWHRFSSECITCTDVAPIDVYAIYLVTTVFADKCRVTFHFPNALSLETQNVDTCKRLISEYGRQNITHNMNAHDK